MIVKENRLACWSFWEDQPGTCLRRDTA